MCGVILVILHDLINADANVGAVPYLLVVIAALCFGISPVFSRLCVKDIHPLMVVTGQVAFAGLQGWVVSLIFDYNWPPKHFARHYGFFAEIDYVGWIMAFSLGATSCIGFSIFFLLIPRIGAAMTVSSSLFLSISICARIALRHAHSFSFPFVCRLLVVPSVAFSGPQESKTFLCDLCRFIFSLHLCHAVHFFLLLFLLSLWWLAV